MNWPKSISLDYPTPLESKLKDLSSNKDHDNMQGKKYFLLDTAFVHFQNMMVSPATEVLTLPDLLPYEYTDVNKPPAYFSDNINLQNVRPDHKERRYDYTTVEPNATSFWVDFANYKLGGGVFGNGYAQEEEMCWETPDLANAAAVAPQHVYTRYPHAGVLRGNPTPVAIQGVHRVMSTAQSLSDLQNTHLDDLKNAQQHGDINLFVQPVTFNVLAIAAPDLEYEGLPFELATVGDLFNSFVAGFQLARDIADMRNQKAMINTGPIGTGIFGNNVYMVWVLQVCAAQKVGLDLRFWSYSDEKAKKAQEDYNAIKSKFGTGTIAQLLKLTSGSGLICSR